jgi:FAD-dependent oxidoreductase domain-containing protein 1
MPASAIVIIGGGVIGSAIASFLTADPAFRGTVTVIERDPTYTRASSALSASSIRQQFSTPVNIAMSQFGIEYLRNLGEQVTLVENGYLFLASERGANILATNHQLQCSMGASIDLLEPAALQARFPWLSTRDIALGAHGVAGEGWFDGYSLLQAFRQHARADGARYLHASACGLTMSGRVVSGVQLADGSTLACDAVVNAAGPWAREIASWVGIDLPVVPKRRSVFVFESPQSTPQCPLVIDPSGVYFRPEGKGYICGVSPDAVNGWPDPDEPPLDPEHEMFERLIWPVLAMRVPGFEALRQSRAWAGYYEMNTFDANGIVGAHPEIENFYFANGFSGHGIQQSPAVGRGLAELIILGAYQTLDLSALAFDRILANQPLRELNVV